MNTRYEDFYSKYINVHNKARIAFSLAESGGVSSALSKAISETMEKVSKSKIIGDNDNTIGLYNSAIESIETKLTSLNNFAQKYEYVETKYVGLAMGLDELYEYDNDLKEIIKREPKESMYKIITEEGETIDYLKYNVAFNKWKKEIVSTKKWAKQLSNDVSEVINYLNSINGVDPKSFFNNANFPNKLFSPNEANKKYLESKVVDSYYLDPNGKEFEAFIKENKIMNPDNAKILKRTIMVNDVPIDTFTIYNINSNEFDTNSFNSYVSDCISEEEIIDPTILTNIFNGNNKSNIIFIQDYDQEFYYNPNTNTHMDSLTTAYYSLESNNITMLCCAGYYPDSIVHETGHAFDHLLASKKNIGPTYYSKKKWYDIIKQEAIYFNESHKELKSDIRFAAEEHAYAYLEEHFPEIDKDDYEIVEEDGDWRLYINNTNPIDSTGVTIDNRPPSGYSLTDYKLYSQEYFADVFKTFWMGDYCNEKDGGISKLEYLCPQTYEELYNLINEEINHSN